MTGTSDLTWARPKRGSARAASDHQIQPKELHPVNERDLTATGARFPDVSVQLTGEVR